MRARGMVALTGDSVPATMMLILWGSAAMSAIVDNIPFVATMSPVVDQLVGGTGPLAGQNGLWWALVPGADLGGNATAIGASANVVVAGIAKKSGHPISHSGSSRGTASSSRWSRWPSPRPTCCCAPEPHRTQDYCVLSAA